MLTFFLIPHIDFQPNMLFLLYVYFIDIDPMSFPISCVEKQYLVLRGDETPRAWLLARVSFSPYEASLWEWSVLPQASGEYLLSPCWSTHSLPHVISHKQLAKHMCSQPDLASWKWKLVAYEAGQPAATFNLTPFLFSQPES